MELLRGKDQCCHKIPPPLHDLIIEPFAGSARYALQYWERDVLLVDKYPVITGIWKWLQQCSPKDILSLPVPGPGKTTDDLRYDCPEAKHLMGFLISAGSYMPMRTPSSWSTKYTWKNPDKFKKQVADNLHKIRHWTIREGCYKEIPNQRATWFIDPPYETGGHKYRFSNKRIDYRHLARWSKERSGQVIVCEKTTATWMRFRPLATQRGIAGIQSEGIWYRSR